MLLLLDEPETHFNDKWKREIVEIVDEAIRNTVNDVLISTHSAIVLSDAFHDEIVLLEKTEGGARRVELASPTFGADPSEWMVRVFGALESIGKRAQEWLEDRLPESEWTVDDIGELEALIRKIGPGFYRSELLTLLNKRRKNAMLRPIEGLPYRPVLEASHALLCRLIQWLCDPARIPGDVTDANFKALHPAEVVGN